MPVSIIFGGQFGSEGKGKVAHFIADFQGAKAVIRVGGPNSGHTVMRGEQPLVLKQLPTASILKNIYAVIPSGAYINPNILLNEIELTNIEKSLVVIDPYAVLIEPEDVEHESQVGIKDTIGSTGSGTGAALSRRISRLSNIKFAKDDHNLSQYVQPTKPFLRSLLDENHIIIIEGTQGYGLSLLHSDLYPYCTSRDTSAAAFLSESGLSPIDVDEIIMVIRSYPIRVGGNSGPLPFEISWPQLTKESGNSQPLMEFTSVTKKLRRIAQFDADVVKRSIEANCPTKIVLNHVDYFDANCRQEQISMLAMEHITRIESLIDRKIDFIGMNRHTIYNREDLFLKNQKQLNNLIHE